MENLNINAILKHRVKNSIDTIQPILKVCGNRHRYTLLIHILDKPRTLKDLTEFTNLSKTALSNHLRKLQKTGLVLRKDYGLYEISPRGIEIFQFIASLYDRFLIDSTHVSPTYELDHQNSSEIKSSLKQYMVTKPAHYQYGWISFNSCISGILQSLGVSIDLHDISGSTGYCFLTNIKKSILDASGPTGFSNYIWTEIFHGIEQFGWQLVLHKETDPYYPSLTKNHELQVQALRLYYWVCDQLQKEDRPLILWGAPVPEYAIVNGFEDFHYDVSTFRSIMGMSEDLIRFDMLQSPGVLHAMKIVKKAQEVSQEMYDFHSIGRAITFMTKAPPLQDFINGLDAYQHWHDMILKNIDNHDVYHGNSYLGESYLELKRDAAIYLNRLAKKYPEEQFGHYLELAAHEFSEMGDILHKFQQLFPFAMQGKMTEDKCRKGAKLIKLLEDYEKSAVKYLKNVKNLWKVKKR